MGLTDASVQLVDPNGNLMSILPTGASRAGQDASQLFYDTFDTGLDTTNNWNAGVSAGGGVVAAVSSGVLTLGTGTTANGYSYIQSRPTLSPVAPGWLPVFYAVTIENPVTANTYRFWGNATFPGTPTAAAPLTNGIGFEVTTAGKLFAISYAGGTRNVIQDLSAATGNGRQPADGAQHKYFCYFRGDLAYFTIDDVPVATMSTGSLGPAVNILPLGLAAIAGSSAPSVSGVLSVGAVWVGDTTQSKATVLADASFPYRRLTIKAASTAPAATDTAIVTGLHPSSSLPLAKDTASSGTISAASSFGVIVFGGISTSVPAANTSVTFTTSGYSSLITTASGTFNGTLAFEATNDGTNWATIYGSIPDLAPQFGFTQSQMARIAIGGFQQVRVRAVSGTTFTGSVTITGNLSVGPEVIALVEPLPSGVSTLGAVASVDGFKTSYSATATAFAAAATATDIFTLTGSASKTIRVCRLIMSATQTTASIANVLLIKRSSANTGGTSTTLTAVPNDNTNAAATATARSYTANPSALGATVGTIRTYRLGLPSSTGGTLGALFLDQEFGVANCQAVVLRGTGDTFAVNLNSTTFTGGTWSIGIEWTEE